MPGSVERQPWNWQGASALVLAVSIGFGWLAGVILAALDASKGGLDPELSSLLNGIGQVLAGALGTYLGFAAGTRANAEPPPVVVSPVESPAPPPTTTGGPIETR